MKVIHLISGGDVGGAKTHVLSLLRELNTQITAHLVSFRKGEFSDEAIALGIDTTIINTGNIFLDYKLLIRTVKSGGYDIIHCHGARGNMMGAWLKRKFKIPVVTTVHSDYRLDYLGRPAARLINGTINALCLRIIDYRIGVSDAMAETLVSRGFPADRLYTIYNGLDFTKIAKPKRTRCEYFRLLGIEIAEDDVVVGIAARLSPVKDIPTLLRGFSMAAQINPKLKLVIAGDGEQRERLEALAAELDPKRIFFAGWLSETEEYYQAIDINTLTSLSETFPYALTEAARYKKTAVSSSVGGVPYLIDNGVSGFLFKPGDITRLSECLVTLSLDKKKREDMGAALFNKCVREFSLDTTRESQISIYQSIYGKARRQKNKRDGVIICGAYGRGNAGDDAILQSIILELRQMDEHMPVHIMTRTRKTTGLLFRVGCIYTFNVFSFLRRMSKTKLYINGGGSLIQDVTSSRSIWFYLFTLFAAKLLGNNVMMYGCGIGPVNNPRNRRLCTRILNKYVDTITLREDSSREELRLLGITKPKMVLAADPTLILDPESAEKTDSAMLTAGIPTEGRYICFALRKWRGFDEKTEIFARCAEYAFEKYSLIPVFLPIERERDVDAARMVIKNLGCPYHLIEKIDSAQTAIGMLDRMTALVSMRLHALVFAAGRGTPLVGISYDLKVDAFIKYMKQDLCVPLGDLTEKILRDYIDTLMHRADNRELMLKTVTQLRAMERQNIECAMELLGIQKEKREEKI